MENELKIAALSWAAHKAGRNYGDLVANLTPAERDAVYCDYIRHRREERIQLYQRRGTTPPPEETDYHWRELPPVRHRGGRKFGFNTDAALLLYRDGLSDGAIAGELGVSTGAIRNWRKRQGLPSLYRSKKPHP